MMMDEDNLKGYLKQPHPAQIIGILRVLGVGYHPEELLPLDHERA
jgi:hypothetical protein